jgi:glucose-1-phosphate cytidylyltransferase
VEIGGRPILWHIMKTYAHHGFSEFVLCLGYRGNMIKDYFLNYEAMNNDFTIWLGRGSSCRFHGSHKEQDFTVTLAETGAETLTGGRIQRVKKYVDSGTFMVAYGDGIGDVDIRKVYEFHKEHGKLATVTVVHSVSRFGLVDIDNGRVSSFIEKPETSARISAGFFVFEPGVFDYLTGDDCVLERAPLQRLVSEGQLMAYQHEGCFFAMDTYREYQRLNQLWATNQAPWKVWE